MAHLVKRWTVVCLDLHAAFDIFSTPERAAALALHMNKNSIEKENAEPGTSSCRYTVMEIYITVMDNAEAKQAINASPSTPKERMN